MIPPYEGADNQFLDLPSLLALIVYWLVIAYIVHRPIRTHGKTR